MLFCSCLNIRCGVIVIGQNSHGNSPEWRTKEKSWSCVHKGNAFPKMMKWAILMYEEWTQTSIHPETQGSGSFPRTKYSSKCVMSPGALQERCGTVKGTDQVDGNKAGCGLALIECHWGPSNHFYTC